MYLKEKIIYCPFDKEKLIKANVAPTFYNHTVEIRASES